MFLITQEGDTEEVLVALLTHSQCRITTSALGRGAGGMNSSGCRCQLQQEGEARLQHPCSFLLLLELHHPPHSYWYVNHGIVSDICNWNISRSEMLLLLWARCRHVDWLWFRIWGESARGTTTPSYSAHLHRASRGRARAFDPPLGRYQHIENVSNVNVHDMWCGVLEIIKMMKQRLLHWRTKELCAKQLFNYLALSRVMIYTPYS